MSGTTLYGFRGCSLEGQMEQLQLELCQLQDLEQFTDRRPLRPCMTADNGSI